MAACQRAVSSSQSALQPLWAAVPPLVAGLDELVQAAGGRGGGRPERLSYVAGVAARVTRGPRRAARLGHPRPRASPARARAPPIHARALIEPRHRPPPGRRGDRRERGAGRPPARRRARVRRRRSCRSTREGAGAAWARRCSAGSRRTPTPPTARLSARLSPSNNGLLRVLRARRGTRKAAAPVAGPRGRRRRRGGRARCARPAGTGGA
jgi:hypothetical protein